MDKAAAATSAAAKSSYTAPSNSTATPPARPWHAHLSAIVSPASGGSYGLSSAPGGGGSYGGTSLRAVLAASFAGSSLAAPLVGDRVRLSIAGIDRLFLSATGNGGVGAEARPDEWTIRPAANADNGEYNILLSSADCGASSFLSAPAEGSEVDLWDRDDGSGRQRWVFRQVGDSTFVIRLAGGKKNDKMFLGVREDGAGGLRLFAEEKGRQTRWEIARAPTTTTAAPPTATAAATTHVPAQVAPELTRMTGLTEATIDVVLQLISLPENSTPRWWTNYNYIEFLGDGRGFTATLYGACSGTGDLAMILEELAKISPRSRGCDELLQFLPELKKKRGDDIKGIEPIKRIIRGLGEDDSAWQQAVWKVYVKLYWRFAMEWADKRGVAAQRPGPPLTLPLTRGFAVDTAINHGANYGSFMEIVKRMPPAAQTARDEVAWFRAFADAREKMLKSGYQDLDTSKTGDRCRLWKDLAAQGNVGLKTPIQAYEGYWGSYTLKN